MSPVWNTKRPKDDPRYFERMTKSLFTAGLNWTVIEKKWPNFRQAFMKFSPRKVARFSEKEIRRLMNNSGIVRNDRKIRATVHNAGEFLKLKKEFGSFRTYPDSFEKDERRLLTTLQEKFHYLGESTVRTFLWSVGYPLTPNREERKWMKRHKQGERKPA